MANYYRVSQDCQEGLYEAVQLSYVIVQVYCSYKGSTFRCSDILNSQDCSSDLQTCALLLKR